MIEFQDVYKEYRNGVQALSNINLTIDDGEFVFIVGASGAGKSTLIKLLIREEKITRGKILIDGVDIASLPSWKIPKLRRNNGVVFQDYRLLSKKTVYENIAFALEIAGESKKTIRERVPEVLELVGLSHKEKSYPGELSGGEGQRLSIARAMVNRPKVLLCDEPTGNLDVNTAGTIMDVLEEINRRGATVIMATHALDIVNQRQKRIVTLENGQIIGDVEGGNYAVYQATS